MRTLGKAVRTGSGYFLMVKDKAWVMSSILFMGCVCIFFFTSCQEPALAKVVQELFAGKKTPRLQRNLDSNRDWHNLLVEGTNNYSSTLVGALHENATSLSPCYEDTTNATVLEGLPRPVQGKYIFHTDELYYLTLVAYGSGGERRCAGGDYYEVDFHDQKDLHYRARLPTVDYGNGSYGLELIVPSRFAGTFSLEIWLLFSNWHGMDFNPETFVKQTLMIAQEVEMVDDFGRQQRYRWSVFDATPNLKAKRQPSQQLQQCTPGDFDRTTWQGHWTRNWSRPGCEADSEKRFRCLPEEHYQCEEPWCFGPVGRLESNGWVYSAHCSFKIFQKEEAWKCLDGRWFLMWGDSNFQDTIRNLLLFVLEWPLPSGVSLADYQLARSYETAFTSPEHHDLLFQVSSIFNGAYPDWGNGMGLSTLQNYEEHRKQILSHFGGTRWPDTVFMNSGLHDGEYFATIEGYIESVDFAIDWWTKLYSSIPADRKPTMVWRTTIAPAGVARKMKSNPTKMEMYNQVMVEKLKQVSKQLPVKFIDTFDLTFPFHYNNDFSDGGHYGRAPGANLAPWYGNPHYYFVDIMVAHIFLNAVCPTT